MTRLENYNRVSQSLEVPNNIMVLMTTLIHYDANTSKKERAKINFRGESTLQYYKAAELTRLINHTPSYQYNNKWYHH